MQDQELIDRARQGDRSSLETIVQRYQRGVYGYFKARLLHHCDAEDLTQEVFLRFQVAQARFDTSSQLRPWLLGIARNLLREHLRRVQRQRRVPWAELCLELDELVPPDESTDDEFLARLPSCLDALGPSARQAIDWHYGAGLKLTEISTRLHRSLGAVKLLLFRARQALRRCLDGQPREPLHD